MPRFSLSCLAMIAGLSVSGAAYAESHVDKAAAAAVKARQAHMALNAFNIGQLGAMAKQEVDYDATTAAAIAGNMNKLAMIDQSSYWVEGTEMGAVEGSEALPEIWADMADFNAKTEDLATATAALQEAAGQDLAALQAAMGPVGKACGACHKLYRKSDD